MFNDLGFSLSCTGCHRDFPFGTYTCPDGDGVLFAKYDTIAVNSLSEVLDERRPGIWRWAKVLPTIDQVVSFAEGNTPLLPSRSIGRQIGVDLWFKDEGRNPTGSFKDRAATLLLSTEKELQHDAITTATSGNAGGALALYSTLANMRAYIFMYRSSREKLAHTQSFGPTLFLVDVENEAAVAELTHEASREFGWSWLTTMAVANPFNVEGYKTVAYEIVERLGVPDVLVSPMTSGTLIIGMWKGFEEMRRMGLIEKHPRLIGVQASRVNPIARAFTAGLSVVEPVDAGETVATGLVLDSPGITGTEALRMIRSSKGCVISVEEDEIVETTRKLPVREGIYAEPSGATSVAGVIEACKCRYIKPGERVVCVVTGSGFKDTRVLESMDPVGGNIFRIRASLGAVREALAGQPNS